MTPAQDNRNTSPAILAPDPPLFARYAMNPMPLPWLRHNAPSPARAVAVAAIGLLGACLCAMIPAPPLGNVWTIAALIGGDTRAATGLSLAALAGLAAWRLAAASVATGPLGRIALSAALPAALVPPLCLPGAGLWALLPAAICAASAIGDRDTRRFACIMVAGCIAPALLTLLDTPLAQAIALTAMLAQFAAACHWRPAGPRAANDNPLLERNRRIPGLYLVHPHVTLPPLRIRGVSKNVHVQQ